MKPNGHSITKLILDGAQASLAKDLGKIKDCLDLLTVEQIWWRPNAASNSAGNLCLHLCGNMRQWIISGLGGAKDVRVREREFSERGPISRRAVVERLDATVAEASGVVRRLSPGALARDYVIQGFRVTGYGALAQVVQHFSHHTGQIIYLTKLKRGRDLGLTRLPAVGKMRG
ncbi:MAG TPA: DUF1572 family protein [Candidatus Acidoferrales bacterium]|nr:DUF1572 family protein [Candidatus Acidoferrales bacterium]